MTLDVFDGARFEFNKSPSNKFGLSHNVTLPPTPAQRRTNSRHFCDEHVLFASRLDMQGRMNGRINAQLGDSVLRLQRSCSRISRRPPRGRLTSTTRAARSGWAAPTRRRAAPGPLPAERPESLALKAEGLYHVHRPITGLTGVARCVWGGKGDNVLTAKSSTLAATSCVLAQGGPGAQLRARAREPRPALQNPSCARPPRQVSEKVGLATELQYHHNQQCTFASDTSSLRGDLQGAGAERHDMLGNARGAHPAGRLDALFGHAQPQEEGLQVRLRPDSRRADAAAQPPFSSLGEP